MLSMLLFLLPPDSGEKVTLGVTILLAFFVNSLVVSNYMPEATSDLPVIGIYYVFNIGLVSVSVGLSVCVLNFHFRGHKVTPVPFWLRCILLIQDKCPNNEKFNELLASEDLKLSNNNASLVKAELASNSSLNRKKQPCSSSLPKLLTNSNGQQHKPQRFSLKETRHQIDVCDESEKNSAELKEGLEKIFRLMKRVTRALERITRARFKEKTISSIYDDWKEIASRIDLVLFLIAGSIVIFTPIGLFGRFFIRDETFKNTNHTCECRER